MNSSRLLEVFFSTRSRDMKSSPILLCLYIWLLPSIRNKAMGASSMIFSFISLRYSIFSVLVFIVFIILLKEFARSPSSSFLCDFSKVIYLPSSISLQVLVSFFMGFEILKASTMIICAAANIETIAINMEFFWK